MKINDFLLIILFSITIIFFTSNRSKSPLNYKSHEFSLSWKKNSKKTDVSRLIGVHGQNPVNYRSRPFEY